MKICKTILTLFYAVIIVICSIVQFHHHDIDGKMVVFSCSDVICHNIEHHHEPMGINCNTCSHGCHDGHHQDEQKCSLKINIAKTEKESISKIIIAFIIIADLISNDTEETADMFIPNSVPILVESFLSACGMRAPPCM